MSELPYAREVHPMYDAMGGVPAIEEVRFSITHNRGCFGGCNFCALAFHQGRMVTSRSHRIGGTRRPSAPDPATPASRATSTTWAAPAPTSATPAARSR